MPVTGNRSCLPARQTAVLSEFVSFSAGHASALPGSNYQAFRLFTHAIPVQTSTSATAYLISKIFSPRKIADNTVPATGTTKLNGAIMLTRFTFSSTLHSANATDDRSVR